MVFLTLVLAFFIFGLVYFFFYKNKKPNIFDVLDIPYVQPDPIFGNMTPCVFGKINIMELITKLYNTFPETKYFGMFDFQTPTIVIRDPDIIKSIAIKNFDSFSNHRGFTNESIDPLFGKSLFSLKGDQWKEMRTILSPSFTSSKMKMMFNLVTECAERFTQSLLEKSKDPKYLVDLKDVFTRVMADIITTCAFGIDIDSMKNPKNEIYVVGREATNFDGILSIKFLLIRNFQTISKFLRVSIFNSSVTRFFTNIVSSNISIRKEKHITRPDFLQLMMDYQDKHNENRKLSLQEITANSVLFFFGGLDSVSSALSFAVHEIAVNPKVQEKLQEEIESVFKNCDGKPTYNDINNMPYMEAVIDEVLRKYPVGLLDRMCNRKFELPPLSEGKKPITVEPGMAIFFPMLAIHCDPKYYPDPEKFDPDRFLGEKTTNSGTYFPFGIGPRICIGNRFALMNVKITLFHLLTKLHFSPCHKTSEPIKFKTNCFNLLPQGGFWLKVEERN